MTTAVAVGSSTPDFEYTAAGGEKHRLSELWAGSPTLILWMRHFG